jgi:hypothetical protein
MLLKPFDTNTHAVLIELFMSQYFQGEKLQNAFIELEINYMHSKLIKQENWIEKFELIKTPNCEKLKNFDDTQYEFLLLQLYQEFISEVSNALDNEVALLFLAIDEILHDNFDIVDIKRRTKLLKNNYLLNS